MNKIVKRYWVKSITLSADRIEFLAYEHGDMSKKIEFIINKDGPYVIKIYPGLDPLSILINQISIGISNYENHYCYQFNLKLKEERESRKVYFVDINKDDLCIDIFYAYYNMIHERFASNMENIELIFAIVEPDTQDIHLYRKGANNV